MEAMQALLGELLVTDGVARVSGGEGTGFLSPTSYLPNPHENPHLR